MFRYRLFYIWLILTTLSFTILYTTVYCKPTIKLEPVTNVRIQTLLGMNTYTAKATTKDGDDILVQTYDVSKSDIPKTSKMYVFRGKSNQAYTISLKKEFIKKDLKRDKIGWIVANVMIFIIASLGSILIDIYLPGDDEIFHKKKIKINI